MLLPALDCGSTVNELFWEGGVAMWCALLAPVAFHDEREQRKSTFAARPRKWSASGLDSWLKVAAMSYSVD